MLGVQEFEFVLALLATSLVLLFYDLIKVGLPGSETVYILIFVQVSSKKTELH